MKEKQFPDYEHGQLSIEVNEWNMEDIRKDIIVVVDGKKSKYYLDSANWNPFASTYLLVYKQYQE